MKTFRTVILLLSGVVVAFAFCPTDGTVVIKARDLSVSYETHDGMMTGNYTSFWPNGKPKVDGTMRRNHRVGAWTLFDSTGKVIMKRNYTDDWNWTMVYPKGGTPVGSEKWIDSAAGYRQFKWKNDSIAQTTRLWRYVPYDESNPVFKENVLIDSLIHFAQQVNSFSVFWDNEFRTPYSPSEFVRHLDECDAKRIVLGYRVKEDWFYDYTAQTGLTAVIAICPVLRSVNGTDSVDLGWFNYSLLKPMLSRMKTNDSFLPANMNEQFEMHGFHSDIYEFTNWKHYALADLYEGEEFGKQQLQWGVRPMEWEHNLWFEYYARN